MPGFRYRHWVQRLKKARLLLQYNEAVLWRDMLKGARRYLINLPDHERNISVLNHYLSTIARTREGVNLSLVVPERFAGLFSSNKAFAQVFHYPSMRSRRSYPVNEELVQHIPRIYDVTLDLNWQPYIVSHYIAATRGTKFTAGFHNEYSAEFFVHTLMIRDESSYEQGVKSLLRIGGLTD